jgi:DNA sulfur modification protein DndE
MKPPVDSVKVSSRGRDTLIQAKRHTGLTQWNELLRWAFCLSLSNPEKPKIMLKIDSGIDPVEWQTFAGENSHYFSGAFYLRAQRDGVSANDSEALSHYFRAHIERGIASLRKIKSLQTLAGIGMGN